MELKVGLKLSKAEVYHLLSYFDDSSDIPLHEGLIFDSYSEKLSKFAYFILAFNGEQLLGFLTYYLNEEGRVIYVPQLVVHKTGRHKGVGHLMMNLLESSYSKSFQSINLEVLNDNLNAKAFYVREGFIESGVRDIRLKLTKNISL